MTTGDRIQYLRKQKGLTLEELGDLTGVGKSTVKKWESGAIANMRRDKLAAVAKALGVTPEYLMGWNESDRAQVTIPNLFPIELKRFPLLGEIACGEPILADEHIDVMVASGSDIHADFCLLAKGDSMIGARIHDGDIVFIRKQDTVEDGEIAAVLIDDEATLKRVYYDKEAGILTLFAENPQIKPMRYFGEELNRIRILGKAVGAQIVVG